ncbi:unnamed protein product [Meganyctiphanes norvegica]|uniref:Uncharacterized protein n=1 Tax=Meganyctiphanes norvegica TaxID=48144 RepID=A0AAV2RZX3_MEGNR
MFLYHLYRTVYINILVNTQKNKYIKGCEWQSRKSSITHQQSGMTHPVTSPLTNMEPVQQRWSLCVPVAICFILFLVGGISMLTGYDHVRAANIVSFAGCMMVFFIFIIIVKQMCLEPKLKETVKTALDPAPAYQKKWRKEYYSNLQETCTSQLNQREEDNQMCELNKIDDHQKDELQAVRIVPKINKCQSTKPGASGKMKLSTLEFQNLGFKEVNVESNILSITANSSSHDHVSNTDETIDLPSYDQAMANEINTSPHT